MFQVKSVFLSHQINTTEFSVLLLL